MLNFLQGLDELWALSVNQLLTAAARNHGVVGVGHGARDLHESQGVLSDYDMLGSPSIVSATEGVLSV